MKTRPAGFPAPWWRTPLAVLTLVAGILFVSLPVAPAGAQTSPTSPTTDCPGAAAPAGAEVESVASAAAGPATDLPADPPASTAPHPRKVLAFTGLETWRLLADGLLLISGGVALVLIGRPTRRRLSTDSVGCVLVAGLVLNRLADGSVRAVSSACLPAAVVPETPLGILLPVAAIGLFALAQFGRYRAKRSRRAA